MQARLISASHELNIVRTSSYPYLKSSASVQCQQNSGFILFNILYIAWSQESQQRQGELFLKTPKNLEKNCCGLSSMFFGAGDDDFSVVVTCWSMELDQKLEN